MGDDRGIPAEIADTDLVSDHGGGDGLRQRSQLEHRIGVDFVRGTGVANSEPLGVQRLTGVYHRDGHARDTGGLHQFGGQAVESGDGVADRIVR